jgi:hypothetical protein
LVMISPPCCFSVRLMQCFFVQASRHHGEEGERRQRPPQRRQPTAPLPCAFVLPLQ